MITAEFRKAYQSLNKEQRSAVDFIEGPVMVIAGPGTGKTQILTLRIANILLKTQVNPENILALTFSEAAAYEMRSRLSRIIGTPAFRAEISTFHSFANNIIKNYPDEFPELLSSDSISEIEQIELLEKIISGLSLSALKPFGEPLYFIKDVLKAINDLKKEGITPEKLEKAIKKQEEDFAIISDLYHDKGKYKGLMKGDYQTLQKDIEKAKELLKIFIVYQKSLKEEKKYDFNDMLLDVTKALEANKHLLLRIQEKYQYILVDEHQDTNAAQNKLVELIADFYDIPNLFVVGDHKQAIYRFQGASLENFLYFQKLYSSAKLINLKLNYRSPQTIIDAATSLIGNNLSTKILSENILKAAVGKVRKKISVMEFKNYHTEYEYIAKDVLGKIKKGVNPAEIAILGRRNLDLFPFIQIFNRLNIKYAVAADQDVLTDLHIKKLLLLFKSIGEPFNEICLARVLQIDFLGITPFDIYKILGFAGKEKIPVNQLLGKLNEKIIKELDLEKAEKIRKFYNNYQCWISEVNNISFDDLFVRVVDESGFKEYFLKSPERYKILAKLTTLFNEVKIRLSKNPGFGLEDFLQLLETAEKHKISIRAKTEGVLEDGVRLLTAHRSKGLEFDYVYIINCFDGRWGNARKIANKIKIPWGNLGQSIKADVAFEQIEDERRLFYVGLTRAKKQVFLSFAKYSIDEKAQLPSQFLQEITSEFLNQIDTSKFEKTFDQAEIFTPISTFKISPKNKEYLQNLFLQKGLSATGLDNFIKCPWRYFFRNLISLPEKKDKNLIFGSAIHWALNSYIKVTAYKKVGINYLKQQLEEYLNEQPLSNNELTECIQKGDKALENFYKQAVTSWPKDIQSEMPIKGVKFAEGIILNGRLDMIEFLKNAGEVRVHDFKSGKPKSRGQIDGSKNDKDYNYLRQLTFYKILLDRYKEGLLKMTEGQIDFVEPDDKGRFRCEVFKIEESQVKSLEQIIKSAGERILNLSFWEETCREKNCEYCNLRKMVFS